MTAKGYCHFNESDASRTFTISLFGHDLILNQSPGSRALGHGAVVWDAAVVMAKHMETNPKDYDPAKLAKKTVIELGSGCGLAGLAFLLRGAAVTFTDMQKVVESLTERNVMNIYTQVNLEKNGFDRIQYQRPKVQCIDWTDYSLGVNRKTFSSRISDQSQELLTSQAVNVALSDEAATDDNNNAYDMVLLTDCVFSVDLIECLIGTIVSHCKQRTTVICCHEIRDEDANKLFLVQLSKYFTYKNIPKSKLHRDYSNDLIQIVVAKPIWKKFCEGQY